MLTRTVFAHLSRWVATRVKFDPIDVTRLLIMFRVSMSFTTLEISLVMTADSANRSLSVKSHNFLQSLMY